MKKTDEAKQLFLDQLAKTPVVQVCCEKLNISRATFYRMKAEDAAFAAKVDESLASGRSLVCDLAEAQLVSAVKDRHFGSIVFWLKTHHPTYRDRLEIHGKITTINQPSNEQMEEIKKALKLAGITFDGYEPKE